MKLLMKLCNYIKICLGTSSREAGPPVKYYVGSLSAA